MRSRLRPVLARAFWIGGRLLLAALASCVLIVPLMMVGVYVDLATMGEGVHRPHFLDSAISVLGAAIAHVSSHLAAYLGWYLCLFGLLSAGAEIAATARRVEFEDNVSVQFAASLRRVRSALRIGVISTLAVFFVFACVIDPETSSLTYMYETGPDVIKAQGWWITWKDSVLFLLKSRLMFGLYFGGAIGLIAVGFATARAAWSIGFWGFQRLLMKVSTHLARVLKIEGASAPIASILLTLIGILIALL